MATKKQPAAKPSGEPGPTSFVHGLRRVRRSHELSARELSVLLRERGVDVTEDAIYWWERLHGPCRGIFVQALADVLGCTVAELTAQSIPNSSPPPATTPRRRA